MNKKTPRHGVFFVLYLLRQVADEACNPGLAHGASHFALVLGTQTTAAAWGDFQV